MAGINGFPGFLSDFPKGHTKKFTIEMTVEREDINNPGSVIKEPIDLTGCKFYLTFDVDLESDTAPPLEILIDPPSDPLNGKTSVVISDTQSASLEAGKMFYSVRFVNADGEVFVIDMGKIKILKSVSTRLE